MTTLPYIKGNLLSQAVSQIHDKVAYYRSILKESSDRPPEWTYLDEIEKMRTLHNASENPVKGNGFVFRDWDGKLRRIPSNVEIKNIHQQAKNYKPEVTPYVHSGTTNNSTPIVRMCTDELQYKQGHFIINDESYMSLLYPQYPVFLHHLLRLNGYTPLNQDSNIWTKAA